MKMKVKAGKLDKIIQAVKSVGQEEMVMEFNRDNWVVKVIGPANAAMAAIKCPRPALEMYEKGDIDEIGIGLSYLQDFIGSKSSMLTLQLEGRTMHIADDEGASAELATIEAGDTPGQMENFPKLDFEVEVVADMSFLTDFIKRANDVTGSSTYRIGAREDGFYIYLRGDNAKMAQHKSWDFFSEHSIDWSVNNTIEGVDGHVPKEDHAIDSLFSVDFTKSINTLSVTPVIRFSNQSPMKILYDLSEEGKKGLIITYYLAPRHDKQGKAVIPDDIIDEYGT